MVKEFANLRKVLADCLRQTYMGYEIVRYRGDAFDIALWVF